MRYFNFFNTKNNKEGIKITILFIFIRFVWFLMDNFYLLNNNIFKILII